MSEDKLKQFYLNKLKIKELTEQNESIIDELGYRQAEIGTYQEGRAVVEVTPNVRFDPTIATELFPLGPDGENIELYSAKVDATLAKKHLTEEDYQSCQKRYPKNKVEVKFI